MTDALKKNRVFVLFFLLFLAAGGVLLAMIDQGDAIRYFSANRSQVGDAFFSWFTKLGEEYSYIILMVALLLFRLRYSLLVGLTGVAVLVVSFLLKYAFRHPRPSVWFRQQGEFEQLQLVEGVHLLGGYMSFPSGHTASAFALFGLLALLLARKWYWSGVLFFIALGIGISRIYLVQHFLKDVYLGAITGIAVALTIAWISSRIPFDSNRFLDRPVFRKRDAA